MNFCKLLDDKIKCLHFSQGKINVSFSKAATSVKLRNLAYNGKEGFDSFEFPCSDVNIKPMRPTVTVEAMLTDYVES